MSGRRSNGDEKWKEVRKIVRQRDKVCQLCKSLLVFEVRERDKHHNGKRFNVLNAAHIRAVSTNVELCYDLNNIITLCEYCHYCQDHFIDPVTGERMDKNKVWYYWWRAKFHKVDKYDKDTDYECLFDNYKKEDPKKKEWW